MYLGSGLVGEVNRIEWPIGLDPSRRYSLAVEKLDVLLLLERPLRSQEMRVPTFIRQISLQKGQRSDSIAGSLSSAV